MIIRPSRRTVPHSNTAPLPESWDSAMQRVSRSGSPGLSRPFPFSHDVLYHSRRPNCLKFNTLTAPIPFPLLRIEPFDGSNLTLWPSFHSQFQTIIGCRTELSNLEKLNYLRASFKGDALKLVQSIPIREDLYVNTLDRLKVAYDRSNHSSAILYQQLMGLKPKSSRIEDQLNCVRDMINLVYHIDDAKNLNSLPLIEQMASYVHSSFVRRIWKLNPNTMMDALNFMDQDLREELELRAAESAFTHCNQMMTNKPSPDSHRDHGSPFKHDSRAPREGDESFSKCHYCGSNHKSTNCSKYKSYEERINRISQTKVCRRCLQSGHDFIECTVKCGKCKDKHHESLCRTKPASNHSNPITPIVQASAIYPWSQTRMYTTSGVVRNPVHGTACDTAVFLDSGAQVSMISRSLSDTLNLEPIDKAVISLTGLGGTTDPEDTYIVRFDVMTNSGIHSVTAIVKDELPIPSMSVDPLPNSDIQFISEQSIAIPTGIVNGQTFTPQIVLGLDVSHSITKNTASTTLPSGLELIHSRLGPIIIGSKSPNSVKPAQYNDNKPPTFNLFGAIINHEIYGLKEEEDLSLARLCGKYMDYRTWWANRDR